CTYFLRANGFRCPQKPSWVSGCNAGLPLAPVPVLWVVAFWSVLLDCWAAGWSCVVEPLCCARAGSASTTARSSATNRRFFISTSSGWGGFGLLTNTLSRAFKFLLRRKICEVYADAT